MPLVKNYLITTVLLLCIALAQSQGIPGRRVLTENNRQTNTNNSGSNNGRPAGPNSRTSGGDSLAHRSGLEDSITISYKLFDSSRTRYLDSNVLNINTMVTVPFDHLYLGNLGSASRPIIFSPRMAAGFDAGFHAYDAYLFKLNETIPNHKALLRARLFSRYKSGTNLIGIIYTKYKTELEYEL
jgi:hypothetical protein